MQFKLMFLSMEKFVSFSRITVKYFGVERRVMEEGAGLQVNKDPLPEAYVNGYEAKIKAQKELVESLKIQWKLLWSERFNDKIRAEDISLKDYTSLSVERGTVIHANRDFKTLTFKEILEQHLVEKPRSLHPTRRTKRRLEQICENKNHQHQPQKKRAEFTLC